MNRPDPHSHGLWAATAPAAPDTRPLSGAAQADVAIIGAGFTGLSAALHLAQAGRRVTVLEAEQIGFGGSGRNVGLVNAGLWVLPEDMPRQLGPVHGPRLLELLGNAPALVRELVSRHHIDCELVNEGTLHCAADARGLAELQERCRQWQARQAPVELLDAAATARAVGTRAYRGSLLDHRASTIQPLAYARGLARAAQAAGAVIHTGSRLQAVHDRHDRWILQTREGHLDADWIIVATNAFTHNIWPELQQQLIRLPYFNLATEPLDAQQQAAILPGRQGAWDTHRILSSFRYDQAGRLVFGSVGALRGPGGRVHRDWGRRALLKLFPQLRHTGFEYSWYGQIGTTANAMPRFQQLARRTISISGYNGRGIAPGTVFGRELARFILGECPAEAMALPLAPTKAAAFKPLRERFYEYGAIAAHAIAARF